MKNTAIPLIGVCCLLLAACTGSFAKVRTAIDQAPDWYDARRVEIRGEGYPEIIDVPVIAEGQTPGQTLETSKSRGDELRAIFAADARAVEPANIAAEIEDLRETVRRGFAGLEATSEFLTDEEIAAIRSAFDVPRVTRGLRAASR
ncbi:MAG: hypothetical protein R3265_06090 [Hyphomonas sp.]|nr:hypothetical protein [Hyphomonas sp.]